jgi:NitT/TauT family transport system permease protein
MKGIADIDRDVVDLMKTYSATKWQIFIKVRVPYALSDLFVGLKVASSFAVIGAIISEYVGVTKGIGYLIKASTYYSETDLTFAGIVAASLVGISLYWLVERIERWVVYWKTNHQTG